MLRGVNDVDAAAEDRYGRTVRIQGALMSLAVDSSRETADDDKSLGRQLETQALSHSPACIASRACSDNRDTVGLVHAGGTAHKQVRRRIRNMAKIWRVVRIIPFDQASADSRQFAQFFFDRIEVAKINNAARDIARNAGRSNLVGADVEDILGGAEFLDQQPAGSRTDAVNAAQRQPIDVR